MTQPEKEFSRVGVYVDRHHMLMCGGNAYDALLLSQIVYWDGRKGKLGWIAKNHGEWFDEIGINERTVRRCLNRLKDLCLIEYEIGGFGGSKKPHLRINWSKYQQSLSAISSDLSCQIETDPRGQIDNLILTPEVGETDPIGQTFRPHRSDILTSEVESNIETIETNIETIENLKDISKDISPQADENAPPKETEKASSLSAKSVESETKTKIQIKPIKSEKPTSKKTRKQSGKKTPSEPQTSDESEDPLQTRTAMVKAIAFTFGMKEDFGGMNAQLRMQLRGEHKKGKRKEYNFDEPATPVEVVGFKFFRNSAYAEAKIPTTAETLYERFLEFRGDERYARALELGEEKLRELLKLEAKPEPQDDEEYASPEEVAAAFARLAASLEKLQEKNKLAQMTTDEYYAHLYQQKQQRLRREAEQQARLGQ